MKVYLFFIVLISAEICAQTNQDTFQNMESNLYPTKIVFKKKLSDYQIKEAPVTASKANLFAVEEDTIALETLDEPVAVKVSETPNDYVKTETAIASATDLSLYSSGTNIISPTTLTDASLSTTSTTSTITIKGNKIVE